MSDDEHTMSTDNGNQNPLQAIMTMMQQQAAAIKALQDQLQAKGKESAASSSAAEILPKFKISQAIASTQLKTPETFNGKRPEISLWLFKMDQYFLATDEDSQDRRVYIAANLLQDDAAIWWRAATHHIHTTSMTFPTWEQFKDAITKQFKPLDSIRTARDRLAKLRQTGSVMSYTTQFQSICLEIPSITEDEQYDRFLRGLKDHIRKEIEFREPANLLELTRLAHRYDSLTFQPTPPREYTPRYTPPSKTSIPKTQGPTPMELDQVKPKTQDTRTCYYCKQVGHFANVCPEAPPCNICKKKGHRTANCRDRRQVRKVQPEDKEVIMKVKKTSSNAIILKIQTSGAIRLDLHANEEVIVEKG